MSQYRVTIPSITWLGDHNAPSATRNVTSRNKKLAVHAAYMKLERERGCLCYDHNWRHAKVEKILGNKVIPIGRTTVKEAAPAQAFRSMMGIK